MGKLRERKRVRTIVVPALARPLGTLELILAPAFRSSGTPSTQFDIAQE